MPARLLVKGAEHRVEFRAQYLGMAEHMALDTGFVDEECGVALLVELVVSYRLDGHSLFDGGDIRVGGRKSRNSRAGIGYL